MIFESIMRDGVGAEGESLRVEWEEMCGRIAAGMVMAAAAAASAPWKTHSHKQVREMGQAELYIPRILVFPATTTKIGQMLNIGRKICLPSGGIG